VKIFGKKIGGFFDIKWNSNFWNGNLKCAFLKLNSEFGNGNGEIR